MTKTSDNYEGGDVEAPLNFEKDDVSLKIQKRFMIKVGGLLLTQFSFTTAFTLAVWHT